MTRHAAPEPRCPECTVTVQSDWDWCQACGYDPEGLRPAGTIVPPTLATSGRTRAAVQAPARPVTGSTMPTSAGAGRQKANVYLPDQRTAPISPRVAILAAAIVIGLVLAAVVGRLVAVQVGDDGNDGPDIAVTDLDQGVTALPDGWSRIDIDEGAIVVELPGPPVRTRADLSVHDFGALPMAVWGGGLAGDHLYGIGVAELPEGWRQRTDELLASVPLPVGGDVVESQRVPLTLGGHPAVHIEADGSDGPLRATVVATEDRLITLVYGNRSSDLTTPTLDRMVGSLQLT